ncbi:hypothetical protein C8A03DRAFT_18122 [Achaetomium macrosporum]|uniref:Uncharacterized protein n=1 Tax=Achaetomium macrosporum TaxID=79813 RepID=A0AAN7C4I4_9PEZI|nr:hypothetical protein C8A03DRAFT_18122 [Achaetomium macrosporum]
MDTHQKKTFLVYSQGLMPGDLTLGSLYLNPANPLDDERKRLECSFRWEEENAEDWLAPIEHNAPYTLCLEASADWISSAGVTDLLRLEAGYRHSEEVVISAKSGRRLRIKKRPEAFLNEVVLQTLGAMDWLADRLSLSWSRYLVQKMRTGKGRHPKIWMLTGLQYMSDVEITCGDRKLRGALASVGIPFPEPVAAAVSILTGQSSLLSAEAGFNRGSRSGTSYRHEDERIWAAQFAPLDVGYYRVGKPDEALQGRRVHLRPSPDLGSAGTRFGKQATAEAQQDAVAVITGLNEGFLQRLAEDPKMMLEAMTGEEWEELDEYLDA